MFRRLIGVFALVVMLGLATAMPTFAQTSQLSGTISAGTPLTGGRPNNDSAGCAVLSGNTFYYDVQTFVALASGAWQYIDSTYASGAGDVWVSFYTGTFDPANPLGGGCFANFDDGGQVSLTAGVAYTIMVSTNQPAATGSYLLVLSNDPISSGPLGGPTLTPGRPNSADCTTTTSGTFYYALTQFTPAVTGTYVYSDIGYVNNSGTDMELVIYTGSPSTFDPTNPTGNGCFWRADDIGAVSLTAGITYTLMATNHSSGATGTYQYLLVAPGGGSAVSICTNYLPGGSVVRSIPAGAPAFYQPDLATQLSFNLPAGTWWTTATSGDFTQVWIGCEANPVWVPTNAIAP